MTAGQISKCAVGFGSRKTLRTTLNKDTIAREDHGARRTIDRWGWVGTEIRVRLRSLLVGHIKKFRWAPLATLRLDT